MPWSRIRWFSLDINPWHFHLWLPTCGDQNGCHALLLRKGFWIEENWYYYSMCLDQKEGLECLWKKWQENLLCISSALLETVVRASGPFASFSELSFSLPGWGYTQWLPFWDRRWARVPNYHTEEGVESQGEDITVQVSMPDLVAGEEDDDSEKANQSSIPLVVNVVKGDGRPCLEFGCTAYPDETVIRQPVG